MEYRQTFMEHSFLWRDSIDKTFDRFLSEGFAVGFADSIECQRDCWAVKGRSNVRW